VGAGAWDGGGAGGTGDAGGIGAAGMREGKDRKPAVNTPAVSQL